MEATIEQKLRSLYNLQLIDTKIDRIRGVRGELPEEVRDLEDEITGLNTRIEKLSNDANELKRAIDDRKNFIKDSQTAIERYEGQQNNVKNNREFVALSKEVELQKLEIMAAEKKIRDFQFQMEEKKIQLENTKKHVTERESDLEHKRGELDTIVAETQREEDDLMSNRNQASGIIDERLMNAYTRVRDNTKNHLAVVTIDRNACAGCFSMIPPQRQLDIRQRKKIIVCENCVRILVDNEMASEVEAELFASTEHSEAA